jgi:galactokinase
MKVIVSDFIKLQVQDNGMRTTALKALFQQYFGDKPTFLARAPGRVNLLGEHVDYNQGPVLPAAIDRDVWLAASQLDHDVIELVAHDLKRKISINLAKLNLKIDYQGRPLPKWAKYPAGVAWALREEGLNVRGVKVVYTSDIPIGSGLSSSAAVEMGFGVLWQAIGGWMIDPLRLAQICQRAENSYVGVPCGLMDQFASACGVTNHALYFDTRSLEWQPIRLPDDLVIIIADSNTRRNLANVGYRARREACEKAVELLHQFKPDIQSLRDIQTTEFAAYSHYLPEEIRKRAEHVVKEIARVQSALYAFQRKDKQAIGALMYSSHNSLRNLYEVSTPELDTLVDLTRKLPGCIGARLTGAGFGGCTVNLVETRHTEEFIKGIVEGYANSTGKQAKAYLCQASHGASVEYI